MKGRDRCDEIIRLIDETLASVDRHLGPTDAPAAARHRHAPPAAAMTATAPR